MVKYDKIISIGGDCACSLYLRNNLSQVYSFPFDWLTNAKLATRLDLILSDFENFLNHEDLKPLEKQDFMGDDVHCDYYENTRNGIYFYHDFPAGENLDSVFPEVKKKYERRVSRFIETLHSTNKVLLVWFSHLAPQLSNSELLMYSEKLTDKFNKRIDLFVIENDSNLKAGEHEIIEISESLRKCVCNTFSKEQGGDWDITMGNKIRCNDIFRKYIVLRFRWYFKVKRRFLKLLSNVYFWDKTKRKAFRNKYRL